jgi:UDP-N-acetyl-D-glucosamine dehydrogenase
MKSTPINESILEAIDAAIVITNHAQVDYNLIVKSAPLVIDTRGVYRGQNHKVNKA